MRCVNHVKSIDSRTGCTVETDILDIHFRIPMLALRALVMPSTAGSADRLSRQRQDAGSSSPGPSTGRVWFLVSRTFRASRVCFNRRILCRRSRPNLDLSPFLSDMIHSFGGYQGDFALKTSLLSKHWDDFLLHRPAKLPDAIRLQMQGYMSSEHGNLLGCLLRSKAADNPT